MITIVVKKAKDIIQEITINGHAEFNDYGKDIVCASVSSMAMLAINTVIYIDPKGLIYKESDGYLNITCIDNKNNSIKSIIEVLIMMLKELEEQYPKNIKIREEEI